MDSSQGASFIPKTPVRGAVRTRRVRKLYVVTYFIYVFFLGALIATAAVTFLKWSVENELSKLKLELTETQSMFSQVDFEYVSRLDQRMDEANRLLNSQISVADIFSAIEAVAVDATNFTGFSYEKDINTELFLTLNARASDFNTVQFQRQVLASNPVLAGAEIRDVVYGSSSSEEGSVSGGGITFTLAKTISRSTVPALAGVSAPIVNDSQTSTNGTAIAEETLDEVVEVGDSEVEDMLIDQDPISNRLQGFGQ